MEQPQYNMLERFKMEKDYLPVFDKYQLGTSIWSPLGSGILSGKYIDTNPSDTRTSLKGYEFIKKKYDGTSSRRYTRQVVQAPDESFRVQNHYYNQYVRNSNFHWYFIPF